MAYSNFDLEMEMPSRPSLPTMPPRDSPFRNLSGFPELCYDFRDTFDFPTFEVLVTLQVVLPILYSFFVPCLSVFCLECGCRNQSEHVLSNVRRKLSAVLVGSWAHWYMHWELWSLFWICMAIYFSAMCAMAPRFYEFTVGMGGASVMVCLISNLLSDFRLSLQQGNTRIIFNFSCVLLSSWILRIVYPFCFDIGTSDTFDEYMSEESLAPTTPPPSYFDAVEGQPPPPSYAEALGRIRTQLPKLSRSISLTAQRWGRSMSLKKSSNAVSNIVQSAESQEGESAHRRKIWAKPQHSSLSVSNDQTSNHPSLSIFETQQNSQPT